MSIDDVLLEEVGVFYVPKPSRKEKEFGCEELETHGPLHGKEQKQGGLHVSAAVRWKANDHPTCKPVGLFQQLVRRLLPSGGIVLDPFLGSGTTSIACILEGVKCVGIEKDEHYCRIAWARIDAWGMAEDLLGESRVPMTVICGDCVEVMAAAKAEGSFDAIITDPPYGLEFMGKEWDRLWDGRDSADNQHLANPRKTKHTNRGYAGMLNNPSSYKAGLAAQHWHYRWAVEALRVLKPGGHLAAMGGTRTVHRLTCALEDAGFEIRDCIGWHYLQGFSKGANISKHLDLRYFREHMPSKTGNASKKLRQHAEYYLMGADERTEGGKRVDLKRRFKEFCRATSWDGLMPCDRCRGSGCKKCDNKGRLLLRRRNEGVNPNARPAKHSGGAGFDRQLAADGKATDAAGEFLLTSAATDDAARWAGWHTGLMPSWEPIIIARKPLAERTIAQNALKHRTGGINVDGCRIAWPGEVGESEGMGWGHERRTDVAWYLGRDTEPTKPHKLGRWPANILRSEPFGDGRDQWFLTPCFNPEIAKVDDALFEAHGVFFVTKASRKEREFRCERLQAEKMCVASTEGCWMCRECKRKWPNSTKQCKCGGELVRTRVKNPPRHNIHPTCKPVALMQHLVRLLTPPGGIVLDPFFGSGTTGIACILEGARWVGIEKDARYCEIARARIAAWTQKVEAESGLLSV